MVAFCTTSFAATTYVLAYDDNPNTGLNTATAFTLDTSNGKLKLVATLKTGGTGLGGGNFANIGTAIASNASCIFVADTGSDDIAAFTVSKGLKITHVSPNVGIVGMFSTNGAGGSIALNSKGTLLVSGNGGTMNISLWSVGAGCILTHVADYVPSIGADYFSPVAFTPNGNDLVVPAPDLSGAEIFQVVAGPALSDINFVTWSGLADCINLCVPTGMDFTSDGEVVVFGSASLNQNAVLSANIGAGGLSNPQVWPIATCPSGCGNPNVPWFSRNGAKGTGELYVGISGYGPDAIPSGEVTMSFTENPLSITEEGTGTLITTSDQFLGAVRSDRATGAGTGGGLLVIAEYPNQIQTFKIDAGGALTAGPIHTDPNAVGLLSINLFPVRTR
jgi:hypothetical protein